MSTRPVNYPDGAWSEFARGLAIQAHVVGALLMREIHTRYGRENIGYLWLIGEPLMLGSVIALVHSGQKTHYGSDMQTVPFTIVGYTIFIMFRQTVNRSEGALEANMALLYHRMVTVFDIALSRALLECAGTFLSFCILISLVTAIGLTDLPYRPLYLMAGIGYMFWLSWAISMNVIGISHDSRFWGRLVHPFTYFMIPFSASFYRVQWIPQPYREYLMWLPFPIPHVMELVRYGQFRSGTLDYVSFQYLTAMCMILTYTGLVALKNARGRIHLS